MQCKCCFVVNGLDPILIYISLWIDCLLEIRKIAVFPLAFIAGWLQGYWWGFISRIYVVWPTFLLMNVFIALKGSHFWFLLVIVSIVDVCSSFRYRLPATGIIQIGKSIVWFKFHCLKNAGWQDSISHGSVYHYSYCHFETKKDNCTWILINTDGVYMYLIELGFTDVDNS